MLESPTAGKQWLHQMGKGAAIVNQELLTASLWNSQEGRSQNLLSILYCMPWPRHSLQSVAVPTVSLARGGTDYHRPFQWRPHILTATFNWALGLSTTKDLFWSSSRPQAVVSLTGKDNIPATFTQKQELDPELQAVVSLMIRAPVTLGDRIGTVDQVLVRRTVRGDGVLLHPDAPGRMLESVFWARAFGENR